MIRVDYPNPTQHIVLLGWRGPRVRSFTVRPAGAGAFHLVVWPQHAPLLRWSRTFDLRFAGTNDDPVQILFDPVALRLPDIDEWAWALYPAGRGATRVPLSDLVFSGRGIASGQFVLQAGLRAGQVRTLVWSCNQPFDTDAAGRAAVGFHVPEIMEWYRGVVDDFQPDIVWGLGDTAYSDGTAATNFADEISGRPGWERDPTIRRRVADAYRTMYRQHWSFQEMQHVMRRFPHVLAWDDHEIRDGYGSEENDFTDSNVALFDIAREVADRYILNCGPRVRQQGDAHQAYVVGPMAGFVFDTRSSRNYADAGGRIISPTQLADFTRFCQRLHNDYSVRVLLLGTTVPFIYLKDSVVILGSRAPKVLTDLAAGVRDDLRDSWRSPGNRGALRQILAVLRRLLVQRPDLHVVNVSGDVHVANGFEIWPPGFVRPIYQLTSSALTNREHLPPAASELLTLDAVQFVPDLGMVRRIWPEITDPNVLRVTVDSRGAEFRLEALPLNGNTTTEQSLSLRG